MPRSEKIKIAILAITEGGRRLAARLAERLPATIVAGEAGIVAAIADCWPRYDGLLCIMAAGIAVRAIAPLLRDKRHDPAVVVVDERGHFAISLLSGHLGGGNELARRVAAHLQGQAVITTASDLLGLTALDLWERELGLARVHGDLTALSAKLVNEGRILLYSPHAFANLPADLIRVATPELADCIVSNQVGEYPAGALLWRPRNLVMGIGCNRGTAAAAIASAVAEACVRHRLAPEAIARLASIDLKKDEAGLLAYAAAHRLPLDFYDKDQLNAVSGSGGSEVVFKATGARAVAEPAARLSAGADKLMVGKMKWKDVTLAIAERPWIGLEPYTSSAPAPAESSI